MLISRKPQQRGQVSYVNLAVKVEEYLERNGKVFVKGKAVSLPNEPTVIVGLSDRGEAAQIEQRPKLSDFRDGINNCGTEIGGLIAFEGAWAKEKSDESAPTEYVSRWPTVLARQNDPAEQALVLINRWCSASVSFQDQTDDDKSKGRPAKAYGTLTQWMLNSAKQYPNYETALQAMQLIIDKVQTSVPTGKGGAMLRVLDKEGRVVTYANLVLRYLKEDSRVQTAAEALKDMVEKDWYKRRVESVIQKLTATDPSAVSFEIVPTTSFSMSNKELNGGKGSPLRNLPMSYQEETEQGIELYIIPTIYTLSADRVYVNKAFPTDRKLRVDPVLARDNGAREYSPHASLAFGNQAEPSNEAEQPQQEPVFADEIPF